MNPLRWVRWKVLIVLGAIAGAFYFLGLNPLARREINRLGAGGEAGARFSVEKVALGLIEGRSSFNAFELATPHSTSQGAQERVARAEELVCDFGMGDFLRRRFSVDELSVRKPLLTVQRRADGTINVSEVGSRREEKPAGRPTDWVKALEEWMERIKRRVEERRKEEREAREKKPEVAREKPRGFRPDYSRKVTYPFVNFPRVVVRKLSAEALEIQFEDHTGALHPPPLKNGKVEILNLTDRPESYPEPLQVSLSGEIEAAPIEISATIDLRRIPETQHKKNDLLLRVKVSGVPLRSVVQAFAGDSLEATFEKGTTDLDAEIILVDLEKLSVRSGAAARPLFALHGVVMKAKPGSRIAGFDGDQFSKAVNEVGDLEVKDLEIGGTLSNPEFRWGESLKEFVLSGGKAFAEKQVQKGLEKGIQKAQKVLDRELKDRSPDLKNLPKALPGVLDGLFKKKKPGEKAQSPSTHER